jgi:hypothetical protein
MELIRNIWERYGFRGNPFDTGALSASAGSLLPITQAIVGREMQSSESQTLMGIVRSAGGGRAVVENFLMLPDFVVRKCSVGLSR